MGYLATALVQIICFSPPLYLCSLVTSLNLACCSFIAIFISDINLAFRQLNDSLTNLPERHKTIGKAPKLAQTLNEIKKFHMDARQLRHISLHIFFRILNFVILSGSPFGSQKRASL